MNASQRDRAAALHAFYAANPASIARKLGLPFNDIAIAFDTVAFTDLIKRHEDRLIRHAIAGLSELNLPIQAMKTRLAEGSHMQRVSLARDICVRLPHNRRWPD